MRSAPRPPTTPPTIAPVLVPPPLEELDDGDGADEEAGAAEARVGLDIAVDDEVELEVELDVDDVEEDVELLT